MIGIVDYGAGNLKSLKNSLEGFRYDCIVTRDPEVVRGCELVFLPGVGAFPDAVETLKGTGLWDALLDRNRNGKPIMGICLGMQLLYEGSDEMVETEGLGFLKGKVTRLGDLGGAIKIPHMGWNTLTSGSPKNREMADLGIETKAGWHDEFEGRDVYFVHSYAVVEGEGECELLYAEHGRSIPALVMKKTDEAGKGTVVGFQFHPEKSGELGNRLLKNAIEEVLRR